MTHWHLAAVGQSSHIINMFQNYVIDSSRTQPTFEIFCSFSGMATPCRCLLIKKGSLFLILFTKIQAKKTCNLTSGKWPYLILT